jgi:hypothetical protein
MPFAFGSIFPNPKMRLLGSSAQRYGRFRENAPKMNDPENRKDLN